MSEDLIKYLNYLKSLNRGFNKGLGKAPHKPILLLSILKMIEENKLVNNRIEISSDLVLIFKSYFKKLVHTGHVDNFSLPFFHMKSEPFYRLVSKNGMAESLNKIKSIKSINKLSDLVSFAEIDKSLFALLQKSHTRIIIYQFLMEEYFPGLKDAPFIYSELSEQQIQKEILNETKTSYLSNLERLKHQLGKESFEEEVFVRGGVFKKTVPKIYGYSCCISGFRISTNHNIQMVDACHIIPFSISQDDTIQNGISLSPNIHRAFDRGLLTINQDYIVRVSPSIKMDSSVNDFLQLDGKSIALPKDPKYYPSQEAIEWHRKEIFLF